MDGWKKAALVVIVVVVAGFAALYGVISQNSVVTENSEAIDGAKKTLDEQISILYAAANNESASIDERRISINSLASIAPASAEAQKALAMLPKLAEDERIANIGRQWDYRADGDRMTGDITRQAVVSSSTVMLSSPYSGEQRGRLMLRRHPRWGNDVAFSIERGQLLCNSREGCELMVRFDDGKPFNVHAVGPEDGSSHTIFLSGYRNLESKIGAAKTMFIEVPIYKDGSRIFEFHVEGFDKQRLHRK